MATALSTLRYCIPLSINNLCKNLKDYIRWGVFVTGPGAAGDVLPHGGGTEGG